MRTYQQPHMLSSRTAALLRRRSKIPYLTAFCKDDGRLSEHLSDYIKHTPVHIRTAGGMQIVRFLLQACYMAGLPGHAQFVTMDDNVHALMTPSGSQLRPLTPKMCSDLFARGCDLMQSGTARAWSVRAHANRQLVTAYGRRKFRDTQWHAWMAWAERYRKICASPFSRLC